MNDWDEPRPMAVEALKSYIKDMRMARDIYDESKDLSNEAYKKFKEKETAVLEALDSAGLRKFNIPGLGTASVRHDLKFRLPQSLEDKRALLKYIKDKYGSDFLDAKVGMNYNSLNSFLSDELESLGLNDKRELEIPGLEDPTETTTINWRKE